MPKPTEKALVHWTKDDQIGLEPINHVPPSCRFEGAVTTVQFSGDKKWYPAKIIMISDNTKLLSTREEEFAESISLKRIEKENAKANSKRTRSIVKPQGSASERDLAFALGCKPPVPKHLETEVKAAKKEKKDSKEQKAKGQSLLDTVVANRIARNLFQSGKDSDGSKVMEGEEEEEGDDEDEYEDERVSDEENQGNDQREEHGSQELEADNRKQCDCSLSLLLQKYGSPCYSQFLEDLQKLFSKCSSDNPGKKLYLDLKSIPEGVKQVELSTGTGVYIAISTKAQIKVDFANKPSSMIREILFALYGKEPFRTLTITARGHKEGSYGIPENVLLSVLAFVNRNVVKKMKFSTFVTNINKRAPEWRKSGRTPPSKSHKHQKMVSSPSYLSEMVSAESALGSYSSSLISPNKASPKKTTPKKASPKKVTPKKGSPKKTTPKKTTPKKPTPTKTSSFKSNFSVESFNNQPPPPFFPHYGQPATFYGNNQPQYSHWGGDRDNQYGSYSGWQQQDSGWQQQQDQSQYFTL